MTKTHIIAIIVIIGSILASAGLTPAIAASAGRHRLAYTEQAEQGDPPNVAIGIAMGAFRGLFVNYLWIRANKLKEEGKHHEAIELAKAITSLQPRFPRVWAFHAWNMAYNISVTTQTPEERWQWVQAGIRLLRDEGIPENPGAMLLYKELGWIYTHKINGYTDDSNQFYKRKVAEEWTNVLGTPPMSASGITPRDEVIETYVSWLETVSEAPDLLSQVIAAKPSVQALVDELNDRLGIEPDLGMLRRWTFHSELTDSLRLSVVEPSFTDRQRTMAEIVRNPTHEAAWDALIPHVRKRVLIDDYKMEPKRMIRYTRKFGPMDWRSPATHALYWGYKGVEAGLSTATKDNVEAFDFVNTDRIVVHAIQELWRFGDIYFNYADFTTGLTGYYMAMPNPYFVQTYGDHIDEFRERGGIFESDRRAYSPYAAGYTNFLQDAVAFFYRRGQRAEAEKWAEELRTFPYLNLNNPDLWAQLALPLDEFVDTILFDRFASPQVANSQVSASLQGAYLNGLLAGNDELFRGEIQLTNAAAELNSQSSINVSYEIDPLFGGGRTSLHGIYLGYDISPRKSITTTWLMQSKPNASQKPRLGEEPSRNWVGNVATKLQFAPGFLRKAANWLPRVNSSEEATVNLDAEAAISIPNPNTRRSAYLEDFEAVDESNTITMSREGWFWTSLPVSEDLAGSVSRFSPEDRAYSRWHRPVPGVKRGDLNPDLSEQEERDIVPSLEVRFESGDPDRWRPEEFAGIMRGFAAEVDLSRAQFLEFWVNDFTGDGTDLNNPREGTLHFDFGIINEDAYWPPDGEGGLELNTFQTEDTDNNFTLNFVEGRSEDTGLDGLLDFEETGPAFPQRPGREGDLGGDNFDPSEIDEAEPFLYINGTEANQRFDSEDLNRNTIFDQRDGYFTLALDLADTNTFVDIYEDFADNAEFIQQARDRGDAWRKYRIDLRNLTVRRAIPGDGYQQATPDLERVRYFRIWFENPDGIVRDRKRTMIFSEMRFQGSRWLADGIRDLDDEIVLRSDNDPEDFRLGVVSNKESDDYIPPITPDIQNNVEEKEQSLQILYSELESGHQVRVRKDVPGSLGQDFTVYGQLNYYWRAPIEGSSLKRIDLDPDQYHLECFTWVGSDSLNYYEIAFAFDEMKASENPGWDGWVPVRVDLGELTNLKANGREEPLFPGSDNLVVRGEIVDPLTEEIYRVTIRGRPDIRRIKRYYAGVRHNLLTNSGGQVIRLPITGNVLFNEIRLKEVDREVGLAKRVAINTAIPGFGDVGFEWSETDPSFRGLDRLTGSQRLTRNWNARFGSNLTRWIPTLGIDIPFSLSTTRSLELPRFLTNSDVELLTDAERDAERSEEWRDRFNFQIRKRQPSTNRILQYTLDRFGFSMSGSRSRNVTPRERIRRQSQDTKYNYDLRFARGLDVKIPFTRSRLRLVPSQISVSSSWQDDETKKTTVFPDGTLKVENPRFVKTVNNDLNVTYNPLPSLRTTLSLVSQRDRQLGEVRALGIDWGEEKSHNERISVNLTPDNRFLRWFEPDITYSAAYGENRRPALQRYSDASQDTTDGIEDGLRGVPGEVRHLNNNNDISVRAKFKLTGWIKRRWGGSGTGARPTTPTRDDRRDRGRIDRDRSGRRELPPVEDLEAPADTTGVQDPTGEAKDDEAEGDQDDAEVVDTPEEEETAEEAFERQREEAERQAEEARRLRELAEASQADDETADEVQEPDPTEPGDEAAAADQPEQAFDPASVLKAAVRPLWNFVLNLQPITGNYQVTNRSGFQHVNGRASWLFRLGLVRDPGIDELVDDDDENFFSTFSQRKTERLTLNTQTQLATNVRVDLSFTGSRGRQQGSTSGARRDYSTDWPNATLRIGDVHKWRIFGEMMSSSTVDLTWRKSKSATGVTDQVENPRTTVTYNPRWNMSFHNGLDASISLRLSNDLTEAQTNELRSDRTNIALTLSKKFDAEGALGFLRFGKQGTGSTIDMRVDSSYDRTFQERLNLSDNKVSQQTGRTALSIRPSFSYLFSRNLRAGLELSYSRNNDLSRQAVTQSVGLGFNATLTF